VSCPIRTEEREVADMAIERLWDDSESETPRPKPTRLSQLDFKDFDSQKPIQPRRFIDRKATVRYESVKPRWKVIRRAKGDGVTEIEIEPVGD